MSKSNDTEMDVLNYVFKATAFPWDANTNLYISLHTSDPGEAGVQTTNETAYTNYARVVVARSGSGWTVSGSQASNAGLIQFPQCGAVPGAAITHVAIGTVALPGAGQILYSGALNSPLAIANLIQPQFAINSLIVAED
jgi:hypothetical protein